MSILPSDKGLLHLVFRRFKEDAHKFQRVKYALF
jgi:hypothetical protein